MENMGSQLDFGCTLNSDFNKNNHVIYIRVLNAISIFTVVFNVYACYCIVFCSSNQMKTYRWYLLFHQLASFAADIWESYFCQHVFLFPILAIQSFGPGKYVLSCIQEFTVSVYFVSAEQFTVLILFLVRYLMVRGVYHIPFKWKVCLFLCLPLGVLICSFTWTAEMNTESAFTYYEQKYPCLNRTVMISSGFDIMDYDYCINYLVPVYLISILMLCSLFVIFAILCIRGIRVNTMSSNLRKLHKKFLRQLFLQAFIPFTVVCVPVCGMIFVFVDDIRDQGWINYASIIAISTFSVTSGAVLIVMNPSYRSWKSLKRRTPEVTSVQRLVDAKKK